MIGDGVKTPGWSSLDDAEVLLPPRADPPRWKGIATDSEAIEEAVRVANEGVGQEMLRALREERGFDVTSLPLDSDEHRRYLDRFRRAAPRGHGSRAPLGLPGPAVIRRVEWPPRQGVYCMIGQIVSGYRIVEHIRDGGASSVWKAEGSGKVVAIKVISDAWYADAEKRKAFQREAELTKSLSHPCVIRVHAYSPGPPRPHIVMEYFPSENLKFLLRNRPAALDGMKLRVLKQAAEGLAYVHSQGYVHRDVKPENFLVDPEGSVRLIDFSIAQKVGAGAARAGKIEGTPSYMAPEQIRGEGADARSDAYSFGAVIYEVYAGRPPFAGATVEAILDEHLKRPAPPLRAAAKDAPFEVAELVHDLLQKKREDRAYLAVAIATLDRLASGRPGIGKERVVIQAIGDVMVAVLMEPRVIEGEAMDGMMRELKSLIEKKSVPRIVVDMQRVEYISSALLGKLVEMLKRSTKAGGGLKLACVRPAVRELFKITKLEQLFDIQTDTAAAAAAYLRSAGK